MPSKIKSKPGTGNGDNLAAWLTSPESKVYFGAAWALKADVLAAVITGGNLSDVAREHRVTRAAASAQAVRAKSIFPALVKSDLTKLTVIHG
jgi:hypothetical protein